MRQRKDGEVKRQDLFQAIYDSLSQNGSIEVKPSEIVGHSVTFLTEGFETSSTLMSYMLYEVFFFDTSVFPTIDMILFFSWLLTKKFRTKYWTKSIPCWMNSMEA